eukprot:4787653-Alexandrium_andersonii.AAC.1
MLPPEFLHARPGFAEKLQPAALEVQRLSLLDTAQYFLRRLTPQDCAAYHPTGDFETAVRSPIYI